MSLVRAASRHSHFAPHSSSRSVPAGVDDARLREFDRETEMKYRELQKQQLEDISLFDREWILNHGAEISRANNYMEVRDVETREAILRVRERLSCERKKQRTNLIRAQHEVMNQFSRDRRQARSQIRCDLSEVPSPDRTASSTAAKAAPARQAAKKHSTLFLSGRGKFLESHQVRVGRFKKKDGRKTGEGGYGNQLDVKNFEMILDSADRRCCRQHLERTYLKRFENQGNVGVPSHFDVWACEVNDYGVDGIPNIIKDEDLASDSET
jgi:hypothetical protein